MVALRSPPTGKSISKQSGCHIILLGGERIAKVGSRVTQTEADTLRFVARNTSIPVPRVFESYDIIGGGHCIVMSQIRGTTLEEALPQLSKESKSRIAGELIDYIRQLRRLGGSSVSSSSGSPTSTYIFDARVDKVFSSSSEFHDFITSRTYPEIPTDYVSFLRSQFNDNASLLFTHADLSKRNILVENGSISGIIDWEWAGFYPEHWEFVKLMHDLAWELGCGTQLAAEFGAYTKEYLACNLLQYISPF